MILVILNVAASFSFLSDGWLKLFLWLYCLDGLSNGTLAVCRSSDIAASLGLSLLWLTVADDKCGSWRKRRRKRDMLYDLRRRRRRRGMLYDMRRRKKKKKRNVV